MTVRSCQTQTAYTGSVTHGVSEQGVGTHALYPTKLRLHFKSRATSDAGYLITPPGYQSTAMVRTLPASTRLCSLSTVISLCVLVSVVLGMEAKLQQARFYYAAMYPAQMRKQGELWQPKHTETPPRSRGKELPGCRDILQCLGRQQHGSPFHCRPRKQVNVLTCTCHTACEGPEAERDTY